MDISNSLPSYEESMLSTKYRKPIELASLSVFQRMLLMTDGTVTEMLEAFLGEDIYIVKIAEQLIQLTQDLPTMKLCAGEQVIERQVFLRGKSSQKNHIYAKSLLIPSRLEEQLRLDILSSNVPLGRLWIEHQLETFRQIISYGKEMMDTPDSAEGLKLSASFNRAAEEDLLSRTYLVFCKKLPFIAITEKFPACSFLLYSSTKNFLE